MGDRFSWSAIAAGLLMASPALAADIPARMPTKAPAMVVAYNWSGFYTSSSIGVSWQDTEGTFALTPGENFNTSKTRAWTGSHVGIQGQWGSWVLGIEGSYSNRLSSSFDEADQGAGCFNLTAATPGLTCATTLRDIWTVGGKVGYSFGNWMIYGTGGYANGRVDTFGLLNGVALSSSSERHGGWYAGGGFDVYVTRIMWSDLIVGLEYRHIDLGTELHTDVVGPAADKNMSATADMLLAKATFKWVGAGPLNAFK